MSKKTKIWLVGAAACILVGCIVFGSVMISLDWDFLKLSTNKYQENTYAYNDNIDSIKVDIDTAGLEFIISDGEKVTVSCYEQQDAPHKVFVRDGTLFITKPEKEWYESIGINFEKTKITLHLPKKEYDDLFIESSTGDVKIKSLQANNINIRLSTGSIQLDEVICEQKISTKVSTGLVKMVNTSGKVITSSGSTGDAIFEKVIAYEDLSVTRSTGDIKLDLCDAPKIYAETSTGDIKGNFLTEKSFSAHTDTGRVSVPGGQTGGECKLITDTGDIIIK